MSHARPRHSISDKPLPPIHVRAGKTISKIVLRLLLLLSGFILTLYFYHHH